MTRLKSKPVTITLDFGIPIHATAFPVVIRMTSRRVTPTMDGGTRSHAGVTTSNRKRYG